MQPLELDSKYPPAHYRWRVHRIRRNRVGSIRIPTLRIWNPPAWSMPDKAAKMKRDSHSDLRGAVAQLGERLVRNEEATGSIPVSSTIVPITCRPFLETLFKI